MSSGDNGRVHASPRGRRAKLAIILVVVAYVLWIGVNAIVNARGLQKRLICGANLKEVGNAFAMYARGWDGRSRPVEWLIAIGAMDARRACCPSVRDSRPNYVLVPRPIAGDTDDRAVVAFEPRSNHGDGGNVLFADGHCEFVRGDEYDRLIGALHPSAE